MKVCVVSFKDCWQDENGRWVSYGGFPGQMASISSLFDEMSLIIVRGKNRSGGIPLPENAQIIPLKEPQGVDTRRKISVIANLPYHLWNILKHVRRADVVHTPVPGDIAFLGMVTALLLRKPLIVRYGGSWTANTRSTAMGSLTKWLMRRFAGGQNVMLATGIGESPPAPKMHWIFSTAISQSEIDQVKPILDRGLSSPPELVYIGRLSSEKGLIYLIEAIARLRSDDISPLPRITLIGDGPERSSLEDAVQKYEVDGLITFAGQLDRGELLPRLLAADVCVIPSLTEGFNKASLDAMMCGLPVIATEVGSGRVVIGNQGERGWLVPPGNAEALAETIRCVITEPYDWPSIRKRARAYVEKLTLEAWADEIGGICSRQWGLPFQGGKLRK